MSKQHRKHKQPLKQDACDEAQRLIRSAIGQSADLTRALANQAGELQQTAGQVENVIDELDTARSLLERGELPKDFLK